jgi:hypothetical protein
MSDTLNELSAEADQLKLQLKKDRRAAMRKRKRD